MPNVIRKVSNYLESRKLLKSVQRITKIHKIHNQLLMEIKPMMSMFLLPGKYTIVFKDKFNQTKIKTFTVKEPSEMTIKEIFEVISC